MDCPDSLPLRSAKVAGSIVFVQGMLRVGLVTYEANISERWDVSF